MTRKRYRYATIVERFVAVLVDTFILSVAFGVFYFINILLLFFVPVLGSLASVVSLFLSIGSMWYPIYFLSKKGQTPGKKIMGIYTIRQKDRMFLSTGQCILREVIFKIITFMTFFGIFTYFFTKRKQCLHDLFINSISIKEVPNQVSPQQPQPPQETSEEQEAA